MGSSIHGEWWWGSTQEEEGECILHDSVASHSTCLLICGGTILFLLINLCLTRYCPPCNSTLSPSTIPCPQPTTNSLSFPSRFANDPRAWPPLLPCTCRFVYHIKYKDSKTFSFKHWQKHQLITSESQRWTIIQWNYSQPVSYEASLLHITIRQYLTMALQCSWTISLQHVMVCYSTTWNYLFWCVCYNLLCPKSEFSDVVASMLRSHEPTCCTSVTRVLSASHPLSDHKISHSFLISWLSHHLTLWLWPFTSAAFMPPAFLPPCHISATRAVMICLFLFFFTFSHHVLHHMICSQSHSGIAVQCLTHNTCRTFWNYLHKDSIECLIANTCSPISIYSQ